MKTLTMTQRVGRSLTLLRVFLVASGVLLAAAAIVLGMLVTSSVRAQALEDAKVSLIQYANGVLGSQLLRDSEVIVRRKMPPLVEHDLQSRPDFEPARIDALRYAGLLHDIGKLTVPDAVLTKPDRLTAEEFDVIKQHSEEGACIIGKLGRLHDAVPIIRHHHERWDGAGYPARLAGHDIPLEASIVGLADAWDAMTTTRPYHRALTFEEAVAEVRDGRGTQFAPAVVDAFLAVVRKQPGALAAEEPRERHLQAVG